MPIHARVLDAALRICRGRRGWTFRPAEVVAALPDLNAASVRTHVMSRCCVNAPPHHAHRWPYFVRTGRGTYQILPALRGRRPQAPPAAGLAAGVAPGTARMPDAARTTGAAPELDRCEPGVAPGPDHRRAGEALFSVEVRESGGRYVAESAALPTRVAGSSLESVLSRVVRLAHRRLKGRGGSPAPLLAELRFQVLPAPEPPDPLVAAYAKDVDRTLIRENLRLSVEERLGKLQHWLEAMAEIRGVARRSGGGVARRSRGGTGRR